MKFPDDKQLLGLMPKMLKAFFIVSGATIISSALTFLAAHPCLSCTMVYWIPGTRILAAWVYPTSVIIIGSFLILYGLKFGLRGIGLLVMVCGAFDVFAKLAALYVGGLFFGSFNQANDTYFLFENVLMFGGYALAGFPKIKMNRWLLMTLVVLFFAEIVQWPPYYSFHGIYSYQFYEVALFIFVLKSTELRSLPKILNHTEEVIPGAVGA